jgi:hypothetical protein
MFFQPNLDINETSQTGLICEQEAHKSDGIPSLNHLAQAVDFCGPSLLQIVAAER